MQVGTYCGYSNIAVDDLYLLMRLCIQVRKMRAVAVAAAIAVGSQYGNDIVAVFIMSVR